MQHEKVSIRSASNTDWRRGLRIIKENKTKKNKHIISTLHRVAGVEYPNSF